ncbi:hypothetical protein [Guptibacillus hwajinpoensis]|uniref:hypothetical protein n=1 Tax=Guptibacillus hwajinpoensis TaxID=208199 RepID=UPI00273DAF04|nr:hypothetical protein [Pseudalkalibacillus hwajinpoensis]WLR59073.1 hypothetical protein LC071_18270 [Pseudalkalibacillus hwajinpoensis]
MALWKEYFITLIEIISFLIVGFLLTELVFSNFYESVDSVWISISFILFSLYTLFKVYVLSKKSLLLNDRVTSLAFWGIFIWSVYSVSSPFV